MKMAGPLYRIIMMITLSGISLSASLQQADPYEVISRILEEQKKILDYEVEVEIEVDVEFIKMPVKHATMFYKQPDKVKFRSKDFILLPRRGLDQSLRKVIGEGYSAVFAGEEKIEGLNHWIIKVIPMNNDEIVLSTLWIDQESLLITRMENFTKSKGNYIASFRYYPDLKLPSEIKISFEVKEFSIPLDFVNRTIEVDKEKMKNQEIKTGNIYLRFNGYKINKGLSDELFNDDDM